MQLDNFPVRYFPDLSRFQSGERGRELRVCIATEEIVGPVRNGGIASTYYHLARMLTDLGHKVTVLYLKGERTSDNSVQPWVEWYREMGIEFVALPFESIPQRGISVFWQQRYYAFYRWLAAQEPFDVVHTSEWRGGAMYVLGAKRLGIDFQDTLFLVKASSPHIWNRHYQMRTIESDGMLTSSFAEQKTIEWADIVIGGSAHLLSFMEHMGYQLPEGRVYVQPNVIDFQDLGVNEQRPDYAFGDVVKTDEIVFFGRLEARKGLEIFCDALDKLVFQEVVPAKVYFMGKQGQNMPSYPDLPNIDYIHMRAKNWPFEIEVLDKFDQKEAIGFLCEKPRIAIMPSLIENSTMAVYEALVHKVPFLATDVGGTPELIDPEYHDATLTRPIPEDLAKNMIRLIEQGGVVARPAFKPADNLDTWKRFHQYLSQEVQTRNIREIVSTMTYDADALDDTPRVNRAFWPARQAEAPDWEAVAVSLILYHYDDVYSLDLTLKSLALQATGFDEILLINDGPISAEDQSAYRNLLEEFKDLNLKPVDFEHNCIASSYNHALTVAANEVVAFAYAGLHIPSEESASLIKKSFVDANIEVVVGVHDQMEEVRNSDGSANRRMVRQLPMGGDLASHLLNDGAIGSDFFAARKSLVTRLGGFYSSYHVSHLVESFLSLALSNGVELWVIPEVLCERREDQLKLQYNYESGKYLRMKGVIDNVQIGMKRFLLRIGEYVEHGQSISFRSARTGGKKASLKTVGKTSRLPLYMTRIGVALDSASSDCLIFVRQLDMKPSGVVSVELNGKQVDSLSMAALGGKHVYARWTVDASALNPGGNRLVFKATTGDGDFSRHLTLIGGHGNAVYVVASNPISFGSDTVDTARKALPVLPLNLTALARLVIRKN